jgi:hypothetical protein
MNTIPPWGAWISSEADSLAIKLIIEYKIQSGDGLSLFLGVNKSFSNHLAIRVWVQRMLDDGADELCDPIAVLGRQFLVCMPQY